MTDPLAIPNVSGPAKLTLGRRNVQGVTVAPYDGATQVQTYQGKWWEGQITFPIMRRAAANLWRGFFADCDGQAGTFEMGDPARQAPEGSAAATPGAPTVDGTGQANMLLNIKTGLVGVRLGYLLPGDLFSYGTGATRRLFMVRRQVDLDIAGKGTIALWPRLRVAPADNEPLDFTAPTGLWRLVSSYDEDETDAAHNVQLPPVAVREAF